MVSVVDKIINLNFSKCDDFDKNVLLLKNNIIYNCNECHNGTSKNYNNNINIIHRSLLHTLNLKFKIYKILYKNKLNKYNLIKNNNFNLNFPLKFNNYHNFLNNNTENLLNNLNLLNIHIINKQLFILLLPFVKWAKNIFGNKAELDIDIYNLISPQLFRILNNIDPKRADCLHPNDKRKILR